MTVLSLSLWIESLPMIMCEESATFCFQCGQLQFGSLVPLTELCSYADCSSPFRLFTHQINSCVPSSFSS